MDDNKEIWVEVFRAGDHVDSMGVSHSFTPEDIQTIENKYNTALENNESFIAPVVKGHPTLDAPAYGWIERMKSTGGKLYAKLKDLEKNFVQEVKDGRYKKVSISLYPDYMVKHLGFLGAVQPAVKGMELLQLSETCDIYSLEFNDAELFEDEKETDIIDDIPLVRNEQIIRYLKTHALARKMLEKKRDSAFADVFKSIRHKKIISNVKKFRGKCNKYDTKFV